jgi:hypothetical protein
MSSEMPKLKMVINVDSSRPVTVALYLVAMIVVIVGVDFVFFRSQFLERLIANVSVVLMFTAFYLRFLRRA